MLLSKVHYTGTTFLKVIYYQGKHLTWHLALCNDMAERKETSLAFIKNVFANNIFTIYLNELHVLHLNFWLKLTKRKNVCLTSHLKFIFEILQMVNGLILI